MEHGDDGRGELSRLLVAVRGLRSQMQAARESGLTQAKISRAERDRFPLSPAEAEQYAARLGATLEQRRRLVELTTARVADQLTGRVALVRVAAAIQERFERLERAATTIRGWQPDLVHGSLQTTDYTRAILDGDGAGDPGSAWWAARKAMAALLHEPGREWHLLVSEAALRWVLGSTALMADQVAHIVRLSRLPHVRIGVVDLATPKPFVAPRAFHLYDETATVATDVGTSFLTDPQDVAHFKDQFAQLAAIALYDDDARALLDRIAAETRSAPEP